MVTEIIVDIFENQEKVPVVTHIFRGKDTNEAMVIERAHRKTDAFYNAAVTTGNFRGIKLDYNSFIKGDK